MNLRAHREWMEQNGHRVVTVEGENFAVWVTQDTQAVTLYHKVQMHLLRAVAVKLSASNECGESLRTFSVTLSSVRRVSIRNHFN